MPHRPIGLAALWFGLLGGPAAWTVQELASYALASAHGCVPAGGAASAGPWALAVSVAAVLVGAAAALVAWRAWRGAGEAETRPGFMAFAGTLTGGLFLIVLITNLLLTWMDPGCG